MGNYFIRPKNVLKRVRASLKEYEYWADNEDAIREELHHNQYEDRLYYENGDVYVGSLNEIV